LANINYWAQEAVNDISVKRIVQDIVNEMYVEELDEDYVGYSNQTIKTILAHIKEAGGGELPPPMGWHLPHHKIYKGARQTTKAVSGHRRARTRSQQK